MNTYPLLKNATPLDDYCLMLIFEEDEKRIYDFKPNLSHKFYKALIDMRLFKTVSVNDGEIEWVTNQDFCLHTLCEESEPIK